MPQNYRQEIKVHHPCHSLCNTAFLIHQSHKLTTI